MPAPILAAAIPSLITAGVTIIERLFPDPDKADQAKLELFKMQQNGELAALAAETELAKGQLEVNKAEAAAGPFRGGWRPFIGWTCGFGLAYQFVVRPLMIFVLSLNGIETVPPALDLTTLLPLVFGMLGLGALRTTEKVKGLS